MLNNAVKYTARLILFELAACLLNWILGWMGVGRGGFDPRVLMWINIIIVGGAIGFLLVVILFVLADEGLDSFKETKKDD